MPGSRASVFGEAEDFQAALSAEGVAAVWVTDGGQFRARVTQIKTTSVASISTIHSTAKARATSKNAVPRRSRSRSGSGSRVGWCPIIAPGPLADPLDPALVDLLEAFVALVERIAEQPPSTISAVG